MQSFTYTIQEAQGLHARPAGLLAKKAGEFQSVCTIETQGRQAELTRIFALMSLGVKQGSVVTVTVQGGDEDKAMEALRAFFTEHL
ncbi:MAG: HPr family phosphocarrier protein [Oscillospiraceae bacterium]|nr:HPr family phosphocarrier protein [Oscillospiraceae bacterium]